MYITLLFFHSLVRWLVLGSLVFALYRSVSGWLGGKAFTRSDNTVRHVTATIAHIQLAIGYTLYFTSPMIGYFRAHYQEAKQQPQMLFFGLQHILLMTLSILFITIGSSVAKRKTTDIVKFRTLTLWFGLALLIIFLAIPWPFSPLANRPYIRTLSLWHFH